MDVSRERCTASINGSNKYRARSQNMMTLAKPKKATPATETQAAAAWARLGVMINVQSARATPDLEQLLLDTALLAPFNVRMFLLGATWLHHFYPYVAGHRLARLVRDDLPEDARPTLGLMLDWAGRIKFKDAIQACSDSIPQSGRPLSDAQNRMPILRRQAEQDANPFSRKWGRWISDDAMQMKHNAIRPRAWVARSNPTLAARSTLDDVAASILAECRRGATIDGVVEVSRLIGASRLATDRALKVLELAGYLEIIKSPGRRGTVVRILAKDY
jgi:hypothetical protein